MNHHIPHRINCVRCADGMMTAGFKHINVPHRNQDIMVPMMQYNCGICGGNFVSADMYSANVKKIIERKREEDSVTYIEALEKTKSELAKFHKLTVLYLTSTSTINTASQRAEVRSGQCDGAPFSINYVVFRTAVLFWIQ